jgi:hypothetical protein
MPLDKNGQTIILLGREIHPYRGELDVSYAGDDQDCIVHRRQGGTDDNHETSKAKGKPLIYAASCRQTELQLLSKGR